MRRRIAAGDLPNAWLFVGPSGVGKRRLALAAAAAVVGEDFSPEREKPPGGKVFLFAPEEVEKRTSRRLKDMGVSVAEQIRARASLSRENDRRAIVVDEADRLTAAAQNALLKTLEEPPGGTVLILVTASASKLSPTVRSRCERVVFSLLSEEELRPLAEECFPDRSLRERALTLAAGRPSRLCRWARESELWRETNRDRERFDRLSSLSDGEKIRLAEELARDQSRLEEVLTFWLELAAADLCKNPSSSRAAAVAALADLREKIIDTNSSPRLQLENFLINELR